MIEAQLLCEKNEMRAPWGCEWFEQWKKNIHSALEHSQTLHVFYFEGRRGAGKLSWDELSDQGAKERARKDGGLGASQTAEVAYLDKCLEDLSLFMLCLCVYRCCMLHILYHIIFTKLFGVNVH